jgi:IS605 OrfB family transposase
MDVRVHRALVFHIGPLDPRLTWLLAEFRLITNRSIRVAFAHDIRSRKRLVQAAYGNLSRDHAVYKQYIPSAFEVALGVLKVHRRRLKLGKPTRAPFIRRLMLKAENQSYSLDRETGMLDLPIRAGEHVRIQLPVSTWHRSFLSDASWTLGSVTLVPGKVAITVRKTAPKAYEPTSAIALDTNEDSLDGVVARGSDTSFVVLALQGIRQVQVTYFRRRRKLATKKANDRRVARRLVARDARREKNRVRQRLHVVSRTIVRAAKATRSVIVLEKLVLRWSGGHSHRMSRRRASWPRGEVHRQILYKAALEGVPVIKVNPAWTSKTCPVCGARRRDRVGKVFVCLMCDWEMDRQINAGMNILKTALASNEALARAVRFQPGALRHDVVSPLYDLSALPTGAREEPSGVESRCRKRVSDRTEGLSSTASGSC